MSTFLGTFELQQAFLIAVHGCALLTLGSLAFARSAGDATARWASHSRWLGIFGVMKCVSVVGSLVLGATNRGLPPEVFRALYAVTAGGAYAALGTFAARALWPQAARGWRWLGGGWFAVYLLAIAWRLSWSERLLPWMLAMPAAAGVCTLVGRELTERASSGAKRRWSSSALLVFAAGLAGLALFETRGFSYTDRFQGWTFNTGFVTLTLADVGLASGCAWVALLGWWTWLRLQPRSSSAVRRRGWRRRLVWALPLGFIVIVAFGFRLLTAINEQAKQRLNEGYFAQLALAEEILATSGKIAWWDERVAEGELRRELQRVQAANPAVKRTVVWTVRAGQVVIVAQAAETESPLRLARGEVYREALRYERKAEEATVAAPFFLVPFRDAAGIFVSFNRPLRSEILEPPREARVWLSFHVDARDWLRAKSGAHTPAVIMLVLLAALGVFTLVHQLRREIELELRAEKSAAEAADRAKTEFLAFISHELRTPLQSILGYADLLRETALDAGQEKCLAPIASQGRLLLRIINDILDYTALASGKFQLEERAFELRACVGDCAESIEPLARERGLKFETSVEPAVPVWVRGDEGRLRQILINLLGNACKYTQEGRVECVVTRDADRVVFRVSDTGPGIDPARRGRLFALYGRLGASDGVRGMEMGLALVRRLCTQMGGSVALEETRGPGATFVVRLPLAEVQGPEVADAGQMGKGAALRVPDLGGRAVLIADDNALVRTLLAEFFQRMNVVPDVAEDGVAAVEEHLGKRYDLIVLDVQMPGCDGLEVTRRIRHASGGGRGPAIVGLSAHVAAADREGCLAAGMDRFLSKPVGFDQLARVVAELMERGSPAESKTMERSEQWRAPDGLVVRLREMFMEGIGRQLDALRAAVRAGDRVKVASLVHHLKNSADVLGERELAEACVACEGEAAAHGECLNAIEQEVARVQAKFAELAR